MSYMMCQLLDINVNKTTPFVVSIVLPAYKIISKQIESLYHKQYLLEHPNEPEDNYYGVRYGSMELLRDKEFNLMTPKFALLNLNRSLFAEAEELLVFINKVKKDVRYLQMWFSVLIKDNNYETAKRIPPLINYLCKEILLCDPSEDYEIPEHKEYMWKRGEDICSYYMGLKLIA